MGRGLTAVLGTRTGSEASPLRLEGLIPSGDTDAPVLASDASVGNAR